MGVPAFFRWLSRKYPSIIVHCLEEKVSVCFPQGVVSCLANIASTHAELAVAVLHCVCKVLMFAHKQFCLVIYLVSCGCCCCEVSPRKCNNCLSGNCLLVSQKLFG